MLWIGDKLDADLRWARQQASLVASVHETSSPGTATLDPPDVFRSCSPAVMLLASAAAAAWELADAIRLKLRWPLAPLVSVGSGLMDGRRRSGPPLPGIDEVPWHDLAGRLAWWLADRSACRPGTLGMPATARKEDRFLESTSGLGPGDSLVPPRVAVAARQSVDLESVSDLVAAAGGLVTSQTRGRPSPDDPADVIVWELGPPDDTDLDWLAVLVATRSERHVVLLDSFPRVERAAAALRAGATAVLGRPGSAEALAGTLLRLEAFRTAATAHDSRGIGLGRVAHKP